MADKFIFMKDWYEAIANDEFVETTPQEMAYILYAAMRYAFNGESINIGDTFGNEFKGLQRSMANIYSQMSKIQNYDPGRTEKYDPEAIKRLRLEGKTAKEVCEELGYPIEKANSLTSNKGWKEAGDILKKGKENNTESVQAKQGMFNF